MQRKPLYHAAAQKAQREANRQKRAIWLVTGDGGGWWIHPNKGKGR